MMSDLKPKFYEEWEKNGAYHGKGLINNLPQWEDIISTLNKASRENVPENNDRQSAEFEVWYKNILAVKKVNYEGSLAIIESDIQLFFSLFFMEYDIPNIISPLIYKEIKDIENTLNINTDFNSLKISLSNKFVTWESHTWHTCILQLKGINHWGLRDKRTGFESSYLLEPGDLLFFKEGVDHQVSNDDARSSLVGRFTFGENNE
jgi:hypothetical protein